MLMGKAKRVLKQCGTDAATGKVWIDEDGHDLTGYTLAEADHVRSQFGDDGGSSANPTKIALR